MRIIRSVSIALAVLVTAIVLCVSPAAVASWTAEVSIAPAHFQAGEVRSIEICMVNISRTTANQPHWIHSFEVFLEGPNGSMFQIVDQREDIVDANQTNRTRVDPGVISNGWIAEIRIPDLEPGEYNITIIINSSQGSFSNVTVSQSYASKVIIDVPPADRLDLPEMFVVGVIIVIVSMFVYQIWRTRHDWG